MGGRALVPQVLDTLAGQSVSSPFRPWEYLVRTAVVIGTGLIGTSAALALSARGITVHLADHDPDRARTAAALGAGTDEAPKEQVDLAIVAVPPAHVAATLADLIGRRVARAYVDVASVKGGPRRELAALGVDVTAYIGTHPMAGKEQSGPLAATADLFEGRPWVLTPTRDTDHEVLNLALELVALSRAVPVVMDADAHDRAVALVSHTPSWSPAWSRPGWRRPTRPRSGCAGRASAT